MKSEIDLNLLKILPLLHQHKKLKKVAKILDKRGYSTGDIEKILGLNWLRYFKETLKS